VHYDYGADTEENRQHGRVGRITQVTHQSGIEQRYYGKLGEITREIKTLTAAAQGNSKPPVYTTDYQFDTFGRLLRLTLPDKEVITNEYDSGGNLNKITGTLNGQPYVYLVSAKLTTQ